MGLGLLLLFTTGSCSSAPAGPTNDYKSKFEKRVGANEQQAQAFLDALSRLPAEKRKEYVRQHETDAHNLARVADPQIQRRYQDLVRGSTNP